MWDWIYNHVMQVLTQYPELLAIAGGILFPTLGSEVLRRLWLTGYSNLIKMRIVSLTDFGLSLAFTDLLWYALDKGENHLLRFMTSLGIAMSCFIIHMGALAIVRKRWPWLDAADSSTPPSGGSK